MMIYLYHDNFKVNYESVEEITVCLVDICYMDYWTWFFIIGKYYRECFV